MDLHTLAHLYKWEVLAVLTIILFVIDFYGHKDKKGHEHKVNSMEAILWSLFWVGAGLLFGIYVLFSEGADSASRYYASFVLEKGMSVDNIAVWLAILTGMSVPRKAWHKLLTYGIVGAIVFRGLFIYGGMNLIHKFEFLEIILGLFLVWGAVKVVGLTIKWKPFKVKISKENEPFNPEEDKIVIIAKWLFNKLKLPLSSSTATFVIVLLTIELTDIVFALDSIPIVIALNDSPFVAASSNLFAVLGLRALFFVVSEFLSRMEYLKFGLCTTLLFIASKMILGFHIEPLMSLLVIMGIICISILASLLHKGEGRHH